MVIGKIRSALRLEVFYCVSSFCLRCVLSVAALAVAIMSITMVMHHIAECKGQVEGLMEEFCDIMITGGQNNIGMPCGMVDNWNDSVCNCTAMDMNMTI